MTPVMKATASNKIERTSQKSSSSHSRSSFWDWKGDLLRTCPIERKPQRKSSVCAPLHPSLRIPAVKNATFFFQCHILTLEMPDLFGVENISQPLTSALKARLGARAVGEAYGRRSPSVDDAVSRVFWLATSGN